jgi:5-methylcytosine-specific restriction endonuclease McrA
LGRSYHVDHKQPVSRGGSNWPENLAVTCPTCNLRKSDKTEAEFRFVNTVQTLTTPAIARIMTVRCSLL